MTTFLMTVKGGGTSRISGKAVLTPATPTLSTGLASVPHSQRSHCAHLRHSQRLGGLMSITVRVGLSMSLPLLLTRLSSYSGVKMLLPLLVLKEWSVGLKLTGERKLVPWVLRALGKVLRPTKQNLTMLQLLLMCCS